MCIRDSIKRYDSIEEQTFYHFQFKLSKLPITASHWLLFELCLLYTSDAADERSSVDLGGRRIIKKKPSEVVT